ncbi:hypothetical protein ABBQ32_006716 [Trebouxia sp. C0010 RCD-2024]
MSSTMGWDVREALVLIDQLLESFGSGSTKADEVVGQAKVLWQQNQQSDALDLLCEHIQTHSSQVSEALPKLRQLKDLVEKVGGQVDAQDSKILQLELQVKKQNQHIRRQDTRIEVLEKKVNKADGAYDKRQQRVLLGQAAYALAKIIEQYVYGPAGFPHGLGLPISLNRMHKHEADLPPDQKLRWQEVQQYCSSYMPFEELLSIDKALRVQRFDMAHGSKVDNAKVTLQQLTTWAGVHFPAQAVMPAQRFVQVLSNFLSKNRPLVPDVKPVEVFQ